MALYQEFSDADAAMMLELLALPYEKQPRQCGWVDGGVACSYPLLPNEFSAHLRALHGVTGDEKTPMTCRWVGCNTPMTRGSVLRHVFETHLGINKCQCPECGLEFSRKDSMKKHYRSKHSN
ncbi:hypothetical protein BKA82DRAFT_2958311 [Pisolithus tinctorius]|nr:hypothetical protein BKA82DRAFT_2232058 [Pisolithus tinctorius]KAI6152404.1 hypothetical protein BKA82DRAFT_2958311 [Pisolithus tinctorius]